MIPDETIVFIVDDDPSMRRSLETLLRSVGLKPMSFPSTEDFLRAGHTESPGCLVLDIRLPGSSGLQFQREMVAAGIQLPVIFITGHGDIPMSVAAMKAGAIEFLPKPFRDQDFLDAVHKGIERDRLRRERGALVGELRERFERLTPREREIMALVASGLMNKQIAAELGLSEITVKIHRGRMMLKMEAKSLPDLVRIADRLALTDATAAALPSSPAGATRQ
ncbi:chemotaxis protein CheY [Skermanella stibiiresistens SB22]|uniref:Chemotaxis protein CheY n=1 Tax=Skermanella stibiiresistens SB22 TaxID=1385369 RepID=W9H6K2_9PROT|nr:response regulator transcription factor [Skermanella stibiiresistens]EWY41644.1 chemotaxis protein CheY [Skermanella stibiiresistens SB22]